MFESEGSLERSTESLSEVEEEDEPKKKGKGSMIPSIGFQTIASFLSYFDVARFRQVSRRVESASCKAIINNLEFFESKSDQTYPSS